MSNEKMYNVKICTGTLCHVMGGAELPALIDFLPNSLQSKVKVTGMVCANYCKNPENKPPFVLINNELIQEASIEKIIKHIQKSEL